MPNLSLSLACHVYDRTRALRDGSIRIEGVDLNFIPLHVTEIFWRMCQYQEFDAAEMSMGAHMTLTARGEPSFVGVPVFPSRVFRHANIFVGAKSGIERPEDLRGRRIGVPEYGMTAIIWQRGILQHEYGVQPEEVVWCTGGQEVPGRKERVPLRLPASIRVEPIPETATLSGMLCQGGIDALFCAHPPNPFLAGDPRIRRLFPDYRPVEEEYYRRTGFFPIMHCVVVRRDVYQRNPWVTQSLFKAFSQAKAEVERALADNDMLTCMLPWSSYDLDVTRKVMGHDFWPYGIGPNRRNLETMCQYAHEQGLTPRLVGVDELFAPNTAEAWRQ